MAKSTCTITIVVDTDDGTLNVTTASDPAVEDDTPFNDLHDAAKVGAMAMEAIEKITQCPPCADCVFKALGLIPTFAGSAHQSHQSENMGSPDGH